MLSENWKILLDYKSERNVTKHSLNRGRVLLFWEEKLFHVRFVKNNISLLVNYMSTTRQWTSKSNASDANSLFFLTFSALKTWFELSRVKFYRNYLRETKITSS